MSWQLFLDFFRREAVMMIGENKKVLIPYGSGSPLIHGWVSVGEGRTDLPRNLPLGVEKRRFLRDRVVSSERAYTKD